MRLSRGTSEGWALQKKGLSDPLTLLRMSRFPWIIIFMIVPPPFCPSSIRLRGQSFFVLIFVFCGPLMKSPTMTTSSPPQAANVPTATTIKGARPYRRSRHDPDLGVHKISSEEFASRKSQVMSSIDQKLEFLRKEKQSLREEEQQNEQLGATIRRRLEERRAEEKEREKVTRHVDEVEKISSLLLGLTERLARAENSLRTAEIADSEKVTLESKREKLVAQLMEAQNLKTNIEKRSAAVSRVLLKYLTDEEYTEYEHFIKTKPKLIFELHEISEKIRLGEEQLASLGPGSGLCLVTEEKNLSR
ncbi:unnamed protein product [Cyprideis torosa]|uniref:Uncharacterized protein n=1 Tax=Cyprideis torosa TaxID=163714 RepID=A0A7R8W3T7_9CRUS|nr:unnamed protein product [Cyprideis torosa]CAG0883398.1 unnamed protein product [Cyprideis torosa]